METWVITGGIATGKSTVVRLLRAAIPKLVVFDADACVADLWKRPAVLSEVESALGFSITKASGGLDRDKMRSLLLYDKAVKKVVETVLHPLVRQECLDLQVKSADTPAAGVPFVADIPLYFEATFPLPAERVVVVATSRATQLVRLQARNNFSVEISEALLRNQLPITSKIKRADHVLWNEGPPGILQRQLRQLLTHFNLS